MKISVLCSALAATFLCAIARSDTYRWTENATDAWNNSNVWIPAGIPDVGDTADIFGVCVVNLSGDCHVGHMTLGKATFSGVSGSGDALLLDTGDGSASAVNVYSNVLFGANTAAQDFRLTLCNPVTFKTYHKFDTTTTVTVYFHEAITGGTPSAPCDITVTKANVGWTNSQYFFSNPDNAFCGDLHLVTPTGNSNLLRVMFGHGNVAATDSMLGHPSNVIHIAPSCVLFWNRGDADGIRHKVVGNGTLQGCSYDPTWNSFNNGGMVLGDGFELAPRADSSDFATFTVVAKGTFTVNTNATFRFDVSTTTSDKVNITTTKPLDFNGTIVLDEAEAIPADTSWTLFSIAAGAGSVTWNPFSVPEGYSFKLVGNNTDGWTVTATKLKFGANVQSLTTGEIGDTYATTHADVVSLTPTGSATLRAYYGTTDGGDNPAAWDAVIVYPESVTALGTYDIALSNLVVDTTYYVRHSAENSAGENFASAPDVFTTRAWSMPDVFTWEATNDVWSADVWSIDTPSARHIPGYPGDKIVFPETTRYPTAGISKEITLDCNASVGMIEIQPSYNAYNRIVGCGTPAELTFDMGSATMTNLVTSNGQTSGFVIGTAGTDDGLTMRLAGPIHFLRQQAWAYSVELNAPISGSGDIFLESQGDEYCHLYFSLLNALNTFRGDLVIGSLTDHKSTSELRVGSTSIPANDSMLGDPANTITLRNLGSIRYYSPSGEAVSCMRTIRGEGGIGAYRNDNNLAPLTLGSSARLEPEAKDGTGYGTLTLKASSIDMDPGATFALDLSAADTTVGDRIAFDTASAFALGGTFVLTPDEGHVAPGTTWTIGSVTHALSVSVAGCKGNGFRIYAEPVEGEESSWLLYAEKLPLGTLFQIR